MPEFWFKCPKCGEYEVTEEAFKAFLPSFVRSKIETKIKERIKKGAAGAVIKFAKECPKCIPEGRTKETITIKALWPLMAKNQKKE